MSSPRSQVNLPASPTPITSADFIAVLSPVIDPAVSQANQALMFRAGPRPILVKCTSALCPLNRVKDVESFDNPMIGMTTFFSASSSLSEKYCK